MGGKVRVGGWRRWWVTNIPLRCSKGSNDAASGHKNSVGVQLWIKTHYTMKHIRDFPPHADVQSALLSLLLLPSAKSTTHRGKPCLWVHCLSLSIIITSWISLYHTSKGQIISCKSSISFSYLKPNKKVSPFKMCGLMLFPSQIHCCREVHYIR